MSDSLPVIDENDSLSLSIDVPINVLSTVKGHSRNPSNTSVSSFFPHIDDSTLSLGYNKLSEGILLPLCSNSIFELVQSVNYKRKTTTTGLLSITSTPTAISLKGPSSKDIPQTSLSKIVKVPSNRFNPYIESIEESYSNFHANKTLTESTLEAFMNQLDKSSSGYALNEEQEAKLDSNSLLNIPDVYFSEDFRLDNPRIFKRVVENSKILRNSRNCDDESAPIEHEKLQEKLSSYLDIVEVHLIHEISKSSNSFFSALDDLKKITKESMSLTEKLQSMDSNLDSLEINKGCQSQSLIMMIQKRKNIQILEQGLLQIHTLLHQADLAESSFFNANYDRALQLTDSVFALIRGNNPPHSLTTKLTENWPHPVLDLNKVPALLPLKRLLNNLITDTGKSYAKLFADYLIEDLRFNYEGASTKDILQRLNCNLTHQKKLTSTPYKTVDNKFKNQLQLYLSGLARCGEIAPAFKLYEEKLLNELKSIFKSNLPTELPVTASSHSDDSRTTITNQSGAVVLSDLIRAMTPKDFEDMLIRDYTQMSEAFRRSTIHKNILLTMALDTITSIDSHIIEAQPDISIQLDITNAISFAINSIQRRMAKLIKVRELQNSYIPLSYFLRFYKINIMFLVECELISSGDVNEPILKDVIDRQLSMFSSQFHRMNMKKAIEGIERETWKDDTLNGYLQENVNLIVKSADGDFDEDEWMKGLNLDFNDEKTVTDIQTETRKTLMIKDISFIVPEAVEVILQLIKSYCILKIQFPSFDDLNITEFLKAINLKIHQSVLGAQATKTAGLKHITTKHLALASQFLSFLHTLTPYVKILFLKLTKAQYQAKVTREFDEVERLFMDQIHDIYNKLVNIMADTMKFLMPAVANIDFSVPLPPNTSHEYMENIVKKTSTIARSIQRYLPEGAYKCVMVRIFEEYEKILEETYSGIKLEDETVKMGVLKDIDYFRDKLSDVIGENGTGGRIWEAVMKRSTEEEKRMGISVVSNSNDNYGNDRTITVESEDYDDSKEMKMENDLENKDKLITKNLAENSEKLTEEQGKEKEEANIEEEDEEQKQLNQGEQQMQTEIEAIPDGDIEVSDDDSSKSSENHSDYITIQKEKVSNEVNSERKLKGYQDISEHGKDEKNTLEANNNKDTVLEK